MKKAVPPGASQAGPPRTPSGGPEAEKAPPESPRCPLLSRAEARSSQRAHPDCSEVPTSSQHACHSDAPRSGAGGSQHARCPDAPYSSCSRSASGAPNGPRHFHMGGAVMDAPLSFEKSLPRETAPPVLPRVESPVSPSLLEVPTLQKVSPPLARGPNQTRYRAKFTNSVLSGLVYWFFYTSIDDKEKPVPSFPFVVELSDSFASIPSPPSLSSPEPEVDSYFASLEMTSPPSPPAYRPHPVEEGGPTTEGEAPNVEGPSPRTKVPTPAVLLFAEASGVGPSQEPVEDVPQPVLPLAGGASTSRIESPEGDEGVSVECDVLQESLEKLQKELWDKVQWVKRKKYRLKGRVGQHQGRLHPGFHGDSSPLGCVEGLGEKGGRPSKGGSYIPVGEYPVGTGACLHSSGGAPNTHSNTFPWSGRSSVRRPRCSEGSSRSKIS
ncbi:pollen-specific leucine-rich repeat extensin-like protein 1 [Juglans microcarpa x Juglans regia]|uniref:pollen-specific leucine-rich repeat extensin-like protein 1 n=1 Tax=Juglans microcarpa x Juglans regia TaxID=2249226 RepID=UPI001B7ECB2B|nr:pollen-specific leucine-rich repeat extensin-like protein 1 [Juglans microcarpa x Juglans regia]